MKRNTLTLLALGASLFVGSHALAQNKGASPASTAPSAASAAAMPKGQKLVYLGSIEGVDANREFQNNVQLVQAQRQAALELDAAIKKEKDAKKKKELQTQLDQLMVRLNENNDRMSKAYGFTLTRNYTMEIEKSRIYVQVSDAEAEKLEKEAAENAKAAEKAKKAKK